MPEYEYECKTCGAFIILSCGMKDPKPRGIVKDHKIGAKIIAREVDGSYKYHVKSDNTASICDSMRFERVFSIPGMAVHYEDTWVVKGPGGLANDRRDKAWRDRFAKD